jgi:hypothetical protein
MLNLGAVDRILCIGVLYLEAWFEAIVEGRVVSGDMVCVRVCVCIYINVCVCVHVRVCVCLNSRIQYLTQIL